MTSLRLYSSHQQTLRPSFQDLARTYETVIWETRLSLLNIIEIMNNSTFLSAFLTSKSHDKWQRDTYVDDTYAVTLSYCWRNYRLKNLKSSTVATVGPRSCYGIIQVEDISLSLTSSPEGKSLFIFQGCLLQKYFRKIVSDQDR